MLLPDERTKSTTSALYSSLNFRRSRRAIWTPRWGCPPHHGGPSTGSGPSPLRRFTLSCERSAVEQRHAHMAALQRRRQCVRHRAGPVPGLSGPHSGSRSGGSAPSIRSEPRPLSEVGKTPPKCAVLWRCRVHSDPHPTLTEPHVGGSEVRSTMMMIMMMVGRSARRLCRAPGWQTDVRYDGSHDPASGELEQPRPERKCHHDDERRGVRPDGYAREPRLAATHGARGRDLWRTTFRAESVYSEMADPLCCLAASEKQARSG
jgi:hypothetical protein